MITEFYKPSSIDEAVKLKNETNKKIYYIAGGSELNSLQYKNESFDVISVEKLGFDNVIETNDSIEIGSAATIQSLIESEKCPELIKTAAKQITNKNIRNIGTIGGNIGSNKSSSNLIPALLCLDAQLYIANKSDQSSISILDYISKEKNDLIIKIKISKENLKRKFALRNYVRSSADISIITAAVSFIKNEVIEKPIIAVGGVDKHIIRLTGLEKIINGKKLPDKNEIENLVKSFINPDSDLRGSAEFKKHIAAVFVADCLHNA